MRLLSLAAAVLFSTQALAADFVALAQKAFPDNAPINRDAMDELWVAAFKLPKWHFLMTPKSAVDKQPSVQIVAEEPWLLVFTDSEKLNQYATSNKNLAADGSALYLSMTPEEAKKLVASTAGSPIVGVRFNEGTKKGWFSPTKNVSGIYEYLKKKGKL